MTSCIVCHGEDIIEQQVDEMLPKGADFVMAPISCLVCQSCGEPYYDTATMKHLERLRDDLKKGTLDLKEVGKILTIQNASLAKAA